MKEQFIPYEIAVQLKQLGFNQKCFGSYFQPNLTEIKYPSSFFRLNNSLNMGNDACTAPLWQQAFDWFREEHDLDSCVSSEGIFGYAYQINQNSKVVDHEKGYFYEDARLACLEKLLLEVKSSLPF